MDALELKVFQVLTERISVSEFENWLYNSEEILSNLGENLFYFEVVSTNYKSKYWKQKLTESFEREYSEDAILMLSIEVACTKILKSEKASEIFEIVLPFSENFDFNSDFDIMHEFYALYCKYDTFKYSMCSVEEYCTEAKFYAIQVNDKLKVSETIKEKLETLKQDLKPFRTYEVEEKLTLKHKLFAFFKKS